MSLDLTDDKSTLVQVEDYSKTSSISCDLYQKLDLKNCQVISQS